MAEILSAHLPYRPVAVCRFIGFVKAAPFHCDSFGAAVAVDRLQARKIRSVNRPHSQVDIRFRGFRSAGVFHRQRQCVRHHRVSG